MKSKKTLVFKMPRIVQGGAAVQVASFLLQVNMVKEAGAVEVAGRVMATDGSSVHIWGPSTGYVNTPVGGNCPVGWEGLDIGKTYDIVLLQQDTPIDVNTDFDS